jgi:DNA invertase Pin-like site-specific DNA recombinase
MAPVQRPQEAKLTQVSEARAVIYVRESLDRYGDERAVERFEQECRRLVKARGLHLLRVLRDNGVRASGGNKGDGYAEVLRMLRARETDYVVIPVVDRFFRHPRDLEDVIDVCLETGAALVAASGEIDLSHDQGRLVARLLTSVAKAETERKGQRQRAANEQAARAGKRRMGTPRPFGYQADHVTLEPAEAGAIRWAADALLGGTSVSAVMRKWAALGLRPPQAPFGPLPRRPWTRTSVTTILRNPALAGVSAYLGEEVGPGAWEPVLTEETWRAVAAHLEHPSRKPPRGPVTLLGGLARCRCGNLIQASRSHQGNAIYRCNPVTRDGRPGPHVTVRAGPVTEYVAQVILGVLSSDDVASLVSPPPGTDTAALRREAAAIRRNLREMAADRALGLISRAQMLEGTERGNKRLAQIAADLAGAAGAGPLAPFTQAQAADEVWRSLDITAKREVIRALCTVTLDPAGRGARHYDLASKVRIGSPAGKLPGQRPGGVR